MTQPANRPKLAAVEAAAPDTVVSTVETITPQVAASMLERNTCNRPLRTGVVERYAQDMRSNRWQYNGQDIIFSQDGTLLDGQHRLMAITLAGLPIVMGVKRGLSADVFATLDAGVARTPGDILALRGLSHYNAIAAAARVVCLFSTGRTLSEAITRREVTDFALQEPYLQAIVPAANQNRGPLSASALAAVLFLANNSRRFDGDVEEFLNASGTGAALSEGDPRLALRNWAINERSRNRGQLRNITAFSGIARAWTAYVRGEDLKLVKILRQPHRDTLVIAGFNS